MTEKPLLVGESNPYGGEQEFALYPLPEGCSGWRLCHLVMGLEMRQYLRAYDRVNLCRGPWRIKEARSAADQILRADAHDVVVLLGARVCAAAGVDFEPFREWHRGSPRPRHVVILPHPSGLSRGWNAPDSFKRAREVLREAGCLVAPEAENHA